MNYTDVFDVRGHSYNQAHRSCPNARSIERALLLGLLDLNPDDVVVDAPAGGGYVAEKLQGIVAQILCVEPSKEFARDVPVEWNPCCAPLYEIPLPTGCADKYASLAGLHHLSSSELQGMFTEAYRILKPDGLIAVADVKANTPQAEFLNGPVDKYTETGHVGTFFESGDLSHLMRSTGFTNVSERYEEFEWGFDSQEQMIKFVHSLFGMVKATESQVADAVQKFLDTNVQSNQASLTWGLIYACGTR